jgi:hypothetical protein
MRGAKSSSASFDGVKVIIRGTGYGRIHGWSATSLVASANKDVRP